jgi:hypothetical protein
MTKQSKIRNVIGAAILAVGAFTSGTASAVPCRAGPYLAEVNPSPLDPSVCFRVLSRIPAAVGLPGCWDVAKANNLSCVNPATGMVHIITMAAP